MNVRQATAPERGEFRQFTIRLRLDIGGVEGFLRLG